MERLEGVGMYSVEFRMRWDFIATYKIIKSQAKLDAGKMLPKMGESRTRGHSLRIKGRPSKTELSKKLFHPGGCEFVEFSATEAAGANSLDEFKSELHGVLWPGDIKGYGEQAARVTDCGRSAMITMNGGSGSRDQMTPSCTNFL